MTHHSNPIAKWSAEDKALARKYGMIARNNYLRLEDPKKPPVALWIIALTDRMFAMYSERLGIPESDLRASGKFGSKRPDRRVETVRKHMAVTVYGWTGCKRKTANLLKCGQGSTLTWSMEAAEISAAVDKIFRGETGARRT